MRLGSRQVGLPVRTAPRRTAARPARAQGGAAPSGDADGTKAKLAVAAKISAAKTLARKLAEERQAAAAAAKLAAKHEVSSDTAAELTRSAELDVVGFAKEAAAADAAARAARRADGVPGQAELQRLKAENEALQTLLIQLAADREEAERRLEELRAMGPAAATAARSPLPPPTAAAPSVPAVPKSEAALRALVDAATAAGLRIATVPEGPAPVGSTVRVLYNLAAGPLPRGSATPALKLGLNRWETITYVPLERLSSLSGGASGDWWAADVSLPKLLYRVEFVVEDTTSGAVDNNGAKDFALELSGAPSAEQITEARLALLEEAEAAAQEGFDAEENKEYATMMSAAEGAAKEARLAWAAGRQEALLAEARLVVAERRDAAADAPAPEAARPGLFTWAAPPEAGATAVLLFNKAAGPLSTAGAVVLHIGYDNWWMKDKRVIPMRPLTDAEAKKYAKAIATVDTGAAKVGAVADWWVAEVSVWNTAATVDFAVANDARTVWANDNGKDYHSAVKKAPSGEKLVQLVFQALEAAGSDESMRGEALASQRVLNRATIMANAARRRRELTRRFLYTSPVTPTAGRPVTIYYNPDRTVLRGRPDVFMRGSFNRWTHNAAFGPVRMEPAVPEAGGLGFMAAQLDVPSDAHVIDLVFQDSGDAHGGFTDANSGLDYHIPVSGSYASAKPLRVAHVAAEMAPIAKAGGLGDVVTALGRAVMEEGHDVEVVLPKYDCIDYSAVKNLVMVREFTWEGTQVKVWRGEVEGLNTTFLEPCNGMFWVGKIYTEFSADLHRFGVFCSCAMRWLLHESGDKPDVLHAHDWQSAPVAFLDRGGVAAAFTIHNLNYGADLIGQAMNGTDVATTVSPTYATEIGGNPVIAAHHEKFYGIRNGIDMDIWDPAADPFLPEGYTAESAARGKAAAKAELRRRMGLAEGDVPVVGCVTRLTHQKGIHLIKHAAWRAMERGAQFVLLGSAPDPKVQAEFEELADDLKRQYPDRARLWFAYDEPLSHLIYAGSDLFLVPSMFEPCGLTQMIAMRYGAVAVVRRTGGLADTVFDLDDDADKAAAAGMAVNGFSFDGADAAGMDYALNRALSAFYGGEAVGGLTWAELVERNMRTDWSWASPAQDYIELYYRALKKK